MGSVLTGLRETEESVRAWVESLDPADYVPALATGAIWHASDTPGDLLDDGRQLGALLYDVRIEEGDWRERLTGRASQGGCSGSIDVHDATIVVQFSYPCRALGSERREDWSAAGDAAEHVLRALCSSPYRYRRSTPPERVMAPAVGGVGSWIVVTVRVLAEVWFHLDPPESGPTGAAPVNYVLPGISGTRGTGETLTAWHGLWTGTTPITYAYQWLLDTVPISGATGSTYVDPDGEGLISVQVTATNGVSPAGVATSQPLGTGGGPVDCATNCADEIAAADAAGYNRGYDDGYTDGLADGEIAGYDTGFDDGVASRAFSWRNAGLLAAAATEVDPSGIGVWSVPDANGTYTVTMSTGTMATTPATGTSLVKRVPSASGAAITRVFLEGIVKALVTGQASSSPLRAWCVVMDDADPTVARGWGAYVAVESGSTDLLAGTIYTSSAGTWAANLATTSTGTGQIEATYSRGRLTVPQPVGTRSSVAGTLVGGASSQVSTPSPTVAVPDYTAGAWLCWGLGSSTTGLAAGDYTIRALAALLDIDVADAVGTA